MKVVSPILLAGGSGTRLWPLSRKSYPKQFSKILSDTSLFQSCAKRLISSDIVEFAPHITLTNADFRFIVGEQLQEVGIDPGPILIEPETKNTAAAILAASIFAHTKNQDAVLLVAPSDHVIPDIENFHKTIKVGLSYVQAGKIVTFGITPTRPETGYGYLELKTDVLDKSGTSELVAFIEKPNVKLAREMLVAGNFLWNAGIFLFQAKDIIDAGVNIALGTDNMTEDMFQAMRIGSIVHRGAGGGGVDPAPLHALHAATVNGAKALKRSHDLGTLAPGKLADITVLDMTSPSLTPVINPVANIVHYGHPGIVSAVAVEGRFLMKDGIVLCMNESDVIEEAQEATQAAWRRLGEISPDIELPASMQN